MRDFPPSHDSSFFYDIDFTPLFHSGWSMTFTILWVTFLSQYAAAKGKFHIAFSDLENTVAHISVLKSPQQTNEALKKYTTNKYLGIHWTKMAY